MLTSLTKLCHREPACGRQATRPGLFLRAAFPSDL